MLGSFACDDGAKGHSNRQKWDDVSRVTMVLGSGWEPAILFSQDHISPMCFSAST
jgi:hypothetical protein